jgi:hypothetical protein
LREEASRPRRELDLARRVAEELGEPAAACTHAYYAAFYAAQEALASAGGSSSKTHEGTLRAFGRWRSSAAPGNSAGSSTSSLNCASTSSTGRPGPAPRRLAGAWTKPVE